MNYSELMIKHISTKTLGIIATDLNRYQAMRKLSDEESALYEAALAELDQRGDL